MAAMVMATTMDIGKTHGPYPMAHVHVPIAPAIADRSEGVPSTRAPKAKNAKLFTPFSKEEGPETITIGTVLFWSWGFWDHRPDSVILRPKIVIPFFEKTANKNKKLHFPVTDPPLPRALGNKYAVRAKPSLRSTQSALVRPCSWPK